MKLQRVVYSYSSIEFENDRPKYLMKYSLALFAPWNNWSKQYGFESVKSSIIILNAAFDESGRDSCCN